MVITVSNQKGGVGKTTTSAALAAGFSMAFSIAVLVISWNTMRLVFSGSSPVVARVDGKDITQDDWDNAHRMEADRLRAEQCMTEL